MLSVEVRQKCQSNGLIDDIVITGSPDDYLKFAEKIHTVLLSKDSVILKTNSSIKIEINFDQNKKEELFTSLQNEQNDYSSMDEWKNRNFLRLIGSEEILNEFRLFLIDLSGRGEGYSYISEYSEKYGYSIYSPEWRLQVEGI